ncbi:MAG: GNAT family N-acetyltransferase [Anaerolineae bacterium]|nr:MAG: GNAT family N-acetyltransferase [Anaerolineae bacterium]
MRPDVHYHTSPALTNDELNGLFAISWPGHQRRDFQPVLAHSLAYVCAYRGETLIGYVNVAWDGGIHAFLLDTTVHPAWRRRGIGTALVRRAAAAARQRGMVWLHVDCTPQLRDFYRACGFTHTTAGLMNLSSGDCAGRCKEGR